MRAANHKGIVVFVLGPPGCGKSDMMVDVAGAATEKSPFRRAVFPLLADGNVVPALNVKAVQLIVHKALLAVGVGFPSKTLAKAMKQHDWVPTQGEVEAGYNEAAPKIAQHKLRIFEECQAMVSLMSSLFTKAARALVQTKWWTKVVGACCAHVFSGDPMQAACRDTGFSGIRANGTLISQDADVVMPWERVFKCLGAPSAQLKYHFFIIHGNHRLQGLLYRLLRNVYALDSQVLSKACRNKDIEFNFFKVYLCHYIY